MYEHLIAWLEISKVVQNIAHFYPGHLAVHQRGNKRLNILFCNINPINVSLHWTVVRISCNPKQEQTHFEIIKNTYLDFPGGSVVKNQLCKAGTWIQSLV